MGYATLGLLFLLFLVALIPSRRLWTAGITLETRAVYLLALLALGLASIAVEPLARYLLPLLLFLYVVPFTGIPARWARWRRGGRGPTIIEGRAVRLDPDDRDR